VLTAPVVAPCVAAIKRLRDNPAFEARHRAVANAETRRWDIERVTQQYVAFFESLQ
jgi:hypothetical protein